MKETRSERLVKQRLLSNTTKRHKKVVTTLNENVSLFLNNIFQGLLFFKYIDTFYSLS